MTAPGVVLTHDECAALAQHVVARHLREHDDWLLWEDMPQLDEQSFEMVCDAVTDLARQIARRYVPDDIDPAEVYGRTQ